MIFILDNFDSFTYNLYQYFGELGEQVIVWRRDQCTVAEIERLNPELIVISPGPCAPADAPLMLDVLEHFKGKIPILGICLGHQAIGEVFGAKVVRAKVPMHGKTCLIKHDGRGVFAGLNNPLTVTRYHSLVIDPDDLPEELEITARSAEGEIMGIRHRHYPIEGVQFHPEAILTEAGHRLLQNAIEQARAWLAAKQSEFWQIRPLNFSRSPIDLLPAFKKEDDPFFLDSGKGYSDIARYSFMGAWPFLKVTAHADRLEYVWPNRPHQNTTTPHLKQTLGALDQLTAKFRVPNTTPFPFAGGAVGFFSYDLKDELEKLASLACDDLATPRWHLAWYDGIVVYDHEHKQYFLTACGIDEDGNCHPELANKRLDRLERQLTAYIAALDTSAVSEATTETIVTESTASESITTESAAAPSNNECEPTPILLSVSREQYERDIQRVIDYILAGDIYQANLTQRFAIPFDGDPWTLYRKLHEQNPAPFAAFLPYDDFQVLCCSPERFITLDLQGRIETRPIKGTRPRGQDPESDQALAKELITSIKDRAELTMIIDLERNDFGRICEFGTVQVEDLIRLEQYPTVWHLVSTISGRLKAHIQPSDIIRAIFPGGSITGAPKIRSMEIIEELEPYKRGIYTGSIGYIGFDGHWDLNIVIRTVILKDGLAYIHAGGGIVADSKPKMEYEETIHKAKALFNALGGVMENE